MLDAKDQARIAEAVGKAEEGTSGEIVCVLAAEVSHYPEVALAWAILAALVVPALMVAIGVNPVALVRNIAGVWKASQTQTVEGELTSALGIYAAIQTALFIAVFGVMEIPVVRRWGTPAALKRHRVERAARQQFAAISARAAGSETGVLIFVAVVDRQVQILADRALHGKADEAAWKAAAAAIGESMKAGHDMAAGVVQAVDICGAVLQAHFPATDGGGNLFSNQPVQI